MQQCPTCGSGVPDNADICPDCGMDLQDAAASAKVQLPNPEPPADSGATVSDSGTSTASASTDTNARTVVLDSSFPESATPVPETPHLPEPAPTTSLILKRSGVLTDERFVLGKRSVIGRFDPDSGPVDVDLGPLPEASYVSRHHAEIVCDENGQWRIKDLGSRNGTFVRPDSDGQFVRVSGEQTLQNGCEVSLGNARFEFQTSS